MGVRAESMGHGGVQGTALYFGRSGRQIRTWLGLGLGLSVCGACMKRVKPVLGPGRVVPIVSCRSVFLSLGWGNSAHAGAGIRARM